MTDKEYLFEIGIRIKVARYRNKITTVELADLCGLNKSTINEIELGKFNTRVCTLRKIASVMDMDIKDLLP